jgi:hypothetical protein
VIAVGVPGVLCAGNVEIKKRFGNNYMTESTKMQVFAHTDTMRLYKRGRSGQKNTKGFLLFVDSLRILSFQSK